MLWGGSTVLPVPKIAAQLRAALDPVTFAVDCLEFTPDAWQQKVLQSTGQNILLNCSRQAGKSAS